MTVLFIIATIVLFLTVDWIVIRMKKHRETAAVTSPLNLSITAIPIRIPDGIFFARSHTWLNLFPSGKVRLGVDDFVSRLFVKPDIVLLKHPGEIVQKGDPILMLKQGNHNLTVRSPIEGDILAVNEELSNNPLLLKEKLFSDGWGYVIKPRMLSEVRNLLLGNETREWIRQEFGRLRDLFARLGNNGSIEPALLQDGGPPIAGVMSSLDDKIWKAFEQEFLQI